MEYLYAFLPLHITVLSFLPLSLQFSSQHLLDLILSLDEPLPYVTIKYPAKTEVVSGLPDFLTGVYHGEVRINTFHCSIYILYFYILFFQELARLSGSKNHHVFTMGSHFILIEWPTQLAQIILKLLDKD